MQLQHYSVQSLTDAWDNRYTIQIAAAAPTAVLPEQACVWCLPLKGFTCGPGPAYLSALAPPSAWNVLSLELNIIGPFLSS